MSKKEITKAVLFSGEIRDGPVEVNGIKLGEISKKILKAFNVDEGEIKKSSDIWLQGERLGGGRFTEVFTLTHLDTGTQLAMKVVQFESQHREAKEEAELLQNEIDILKGLRHERIVSFHESQRKAEQLYLFMDYMPKGSLYRYIQENGKLDENLTRKYTRQIVEGLQYLHSNNITHRDIKGQNLLLDSNGDIKIADFGLATRIVKMNVGSKTNLSSFVGSPYFVAPEILLGSGYGRQADIWSVGCTVIEMLTGDPPLKHLLPLTAMLQITNEDLRDKVTLPEGVSQDARDFVGLTLARDPKERPICDALLGHPFVAVLEDQGNQAASR